MPRRSADAINAPDASSGPDASTDTVVTVTCETDSDCTVTKACRTGTCDQATGTCAYATDSESCFIDGDCFNRDQAQPGDGCKICDPDLNQNDFVNKLCADGETCDSVTGECTGASLATTCGLCSSSDDCETGLTCQAVGVGMFCTQTCAADTDCEQGFVCGDVGGASLCLLATGGCAAEGSACVVSGDCEDLNPCTTDLCNADACTFSNDDSVSEACYSGDPTTRGVGTCVDGTRTCSGGVLGACVGDILPESFDVCGDAADNDCDGTPDQDCQFVSVDLSPVTAVASGEIGTTGDTLHVTFDSTPVGPAADASAPIKVDLGFYPPQF